MPEVDRLAAGADVLITVLPGPGEVRELMLGTGGAAAALRPGTTWIDMTSNSPTAVTEIRDTLLGRGVQVLDAPVGGGVAAARQGSLLLLVGGKAEVVAQHRDLLEILGSPGRVRHVGGYGTGYTAKLLINLLWFGQAVATAEALLLGRASGLDLVAGSQVRGDDVVGEAGLAGSEGGPVAGELEDSNGGVRHLNDRDTTHDRTMVIQWKEDLPHPTGVGSPAAGRLVRIVPPRYQGAPARSSPENHEMAGTSRASRRRAART